VLVLPRASCLALNLPVWGGLVYQFLRCKSRVINKPLAGEIIKGKFIDVTTISIYNGAMSYEWDEHKRQANVKKHGIDFMDVPELFESDVVILPDERLD
jgi:hypothetical protein